MLLTFWRIRQMLQFLPVVPLALSPVFFPFRRLQTQRNIHQATPPSVRLNIVADTVFDVQ